MKTLSKVAWALVMLDAGILAIWILFAAKNVGREAQERVITILFTGLAGVALCLSAGMLHYGQPRQSSAAIWFGFSIAAIPAALILGIGYREVKIKFRVRNHAYTADASGWFKDPVMTAMAGAIDRSDSVGLRQLLGSRPADWLARDRQGRTLLGHAIHRAMTDYSPGSDLQALEVLLEAGARVGINDLNSKSSLMEEVVSANTPSALKLLELVLLAGGDPNATDMHKEPLIHLVESSRPKLEVLARHGVNFQALSRRDDRLGWTALMTAVAMSDWEKASFLVEQGVSPDYRAPDGKTVRSLLLEVSERAKGSGMNLKPAFAAFVTSLDQPRL